MHKFVLIIYIQSFIVLHYYFSLTISSINKQSKNNTIKTKDHNFNKCNNNKKNGKLIKII